MTLLLTSSFSILNQWNWCKMGWTSHGRFKDHTTYNPLEVVIGPSMTACTMPAVLGGISPPCNDCHHHLNINKLSRTASETKCGHQIQALLVATLSRSHPHSTTDPLNCRGLGNLGHFTDTTSAKELCPTGGSCTSHVRYQAPLQHTL